MPARQPLFPATRPLSTILNVLIALKNDAKSDYTIKWTDKALHYISKHADLDDPEAVKKFIATVNGGTGYKRNLCISYNHYCRYYKISWQMPLYKKQERCRKIPRTEKLDKLIASAGAILSIKLRLSKETGLRPVELCNLRVKDVDLQERLVYPATAKSGRARTLRFSNALSLAIADHIEKYNLKPESKLFKGDAEYYGKKYRYMRNALAKKLNDPSLKEIRLYDFRHFFATNLYAKTKDILYVKQQLGHKKLETTLVYVQILQLDDQDNYACKVATTVDQATELIENGFTYVTEMDGVRLFKKRK